MLASFFTIDFILVMVLALYMTQKSRINLFVPTIPSIFVWCYIFFAYIGIYPLIFFWDQVRYNHGVQDQTLIFTMWAVSSLSLLIIAFTFLFLNKVWRLELPFTYNELDQNRSKLKFSVHVFAFCLLVLSVAVTMLYISKIATVPILAEIRGVSPNQLALLRSQATNNFSGTLHYYRLFYQAVPTFLSYFAFAAFLNRRSLYNSIFFLGVFVFTCFTELMTTQKSPIVWYIVGLVIVYLIARRKAVNIRVIALVGILGTTVLVVLYQTIMGLSNRSLTDVLKAIASRAFTGQIAPAYFYLKMFPTDHPFLFFQSFPNPGGVFPWTNYRITVEVMNYINPGVNDVVRSAPTVFWGEMYANFGYGGIIVSSIIVGFVLYLLQFVLFKLDFNPIMIGLSTWLIMTMKDLTITNFSNYIFNESITMVVVVSLVMLGLNQPRFARKWLSAFKAFLMR